MRRSPATSVWSRRRGRRTAPFTPRPLRSGLLGLGVGLFGGIGLALLLHQFDNSLQSRDQVSEMLASAAVGPDPQAQEDGDG